jgi:microcystin-dependent protein
MSNYIGEIRLYAGATLPTGWLACDGSTLQVEDYLDLFAAIGAFYGGDGVKTFDLPDMRGRVPLGPGVDSWGDSYQVGNTGGVESVQLLTQHLPSHTHSFNCATAAGTSPDPTGNLLATTPVGSMVYRNTKPTALMNSTAITGTSGAPHENRQPFLALNYMIATAALTDTAYMGELRIFPYLKVPTAWLPCSGQSLPVSGNSALFALLGTTFGGTGSTYFNLPDLTISCAIGVGQGTGLTNNYILGESGGSAYVTLLAAQNAVHGHSMLAVSALVGNASSSEPGPTEGLAKSAGINAYGTATNTATMHPAALGSSPASGTEPHNNVMPSVAFCFCIYTLSS